MVLYTNGAEFITPWANKLRSALFIVHDYTGCEYMTSCSLVVVSLCAGLLTMDVQVGRITSCINILSQVGTTYKNRVIGSMIRSYLLSYRQNKYPLLGYRQLTCSKVVLPVVLTTDPRWELHIKSVL